MAKTAIIINHLEGLTAQQITDGPGSSKQVQIRLRETDELTKMEFYDTVLEAETRKTEWESS